MTSSDDNITEDDTGDFELQPGIVFTRLNEMVRKQYFTYLENILSDNYKAWCLNEGHILPTEIRKCAEILENKAIKACLMIQFYRKAMVKIIANIRRNTKECRLQSQLKSLIEERTTVKCFYDKCTQTDDGFIKKEVFNAVSVQTNNNSKSKTDDFTPSLQEKIDNFQQKLTKESASTVALRKICSKSQRTPRKCRKRKRFISPEICKTNKHKEDKGNYSSLSCLSLKESPYSLSPATTVKSCAKSIQSPKVEDNIDKELELLFSEEKNEIDDIFGFDMHDQPDDPQIDLILKEIECAKLSHERNKPVIKATSEGNGTAVNPSNRAVCLQQTTSKDLDSILRESLWPCELHMQRQELSNILARLVEEDIRWHEPIQWKFMMLFGEDSDDEFAAYSTTIELNEVLISSCMKRIAPWMVKHLMRPMNEGLIGNRFLFKKLAKRLSRNIIIQDQYPDEKVIKTVVEEFFCLHQTVTSIADLDVIPSIKDCDDY